MKSFSLGKCALSGGVAVALLTGCGGSQPPIGGPAQTSAVAKHTNRGKSWILPEAKGQDLLYLSQDGGSYVYIYSYPQGKAEGVLDTPGWGLCSDNRRGRVYVTDSPISMIYEYARGGTKLLRKLQEANQEPFACATDPSTGNLAVLSANTVAIFSYGKGSPKTINVAGIRSFSADAYDENGNLFVDGLTNYNDFALLELPKGGTFTSIKLDQYIGNPGPVQWDGHHLAVGYPEANLIYQFSLKNGRGKEVGYTYLHSKGGAGAYNPWLISNETVIGSSFIVDSTDIWKYPAGKSPIKVLQGISGSGMTLSAKP
jgi:hypothetical protein